MHSNLSEQLLQCYQRAEACARKAAAYPDGSSIRQDFLDMERRWRTLARSIEFSERLNGFANNKAV